MYVYIFRLYQYLFHPISRYITNTSPDFRPCLVLHHLRFRLREVALRQAEEGPGLIFGSKAADFNKASGLLTRNTKKIIGL